MKIKLMAEYRTWPIWYDDGEDEYGAIDPFSLPIPLELKQRISDWSAAFDATLNEEYPPDSKFENSQAKRSFIQEGELLREMLQRELGNEYEVRYVPIS